INMDVSTLDILGSSHKMYFDIKEDSIVTFHFDSIILPDSNVNEPMSHGFIKYSISPKPGLGENTEIRNKAYIYFDFNPPIVTNEVSNTYVEELTLTTLPETTTSTSIIAYPNPVKDEIQLRITGNEEVKNVELIDITGRTVYKSDTFEEKINVAGLQTGVFILKIRTTSGYKTMKIIKN
ncbi:MAG: T9SS type A sorting domain-containing protein, partial [Bacteroidota bacterium]